MRKILCKKGHSIPWFGNPCLKCRAEETSNQTSKPVSFLESKVQVVFVTDSLEARIKKWSGR